jgi:hypothetical protein
MSIDWKKFALTVAAVVVGMIVYELVASKIPFLNSYEEEVLG